MNHRKFGFWFLVAALVCFLIVTCAGFGWFGLAASIDGFLGLGLALFVAAHLDGP